MDAVVGGRASFPFPDRGFYATLRITALDPSRRVEWHVIGSRHPQKSGFVDLHDWIGTHISFVIEPIDATHGRLRFTHRGLAPLECSTTCTSAWSFFLGQSLREYLETGTGQPARAATGVSSHFTHGERFDAPPGAVYAALTSAAGLRAWWTPDCDVEEHVGGRSTFRFGPTRTVMETSSSRPSARSAGAACNSTFTHLAKSNARTSGKARRSSSASRQLPAAARTSSSSTRAWSRRSSATHSARTAGGTTSARV